MMMQAAEQTIASNSGARSKPWQRAKPPSSGKTARQAADNPLDRTAKALRYAYQVSLPRQRCARHAANGFSSPSYYRLADRSYEYMRQIAADECPEGREVSYKDVRKLMADEMFGGGEWRRIELKHTDDAASELASAVQALPDPMREVVLLYALGYSPQKVRRVLKHRVSFSIEQDYRRGLEIVWRQAERWIDCLA